ncbi:MAG: hypothetical protein GY854_16535 [Deltaproteobacteria bacterium]|nr:hypothetical protein [Deltaproteobacteria bacterium]
MTVLLRTYMARAFQELDMPTLFLASFFKSGDQDKFPGVIVKVDSVRGKEEYAIDVIPYSGSRGNKITLFTRKEYAPPAYDESAYLTAEELATVQPGRTEYNRTVDLANMIVNRQKILRNKIWRAKEMLCRDALILGKITLRNGDVIDFKQRAELQYTTPADWTNSTTDALSDFSVIGGRIRKYGVKPLKDAIFGETALQKFLNNAAVKSQADIKKYERAAITSPIAKEDGADYHGTFSAGSYNVNIWSYPQVVGIPMGFGLPNEGTKQPYIPADKVICLGADPDFRLFYAANAVLADPVSAELMGMTGLPMLPSLVPGEMQPYFILDERHASVEIGIRSRPLPVPVGIGEFGIMTVT